MAGAHRGPDHGHGWAGFASATSLMLVALLLPASDAAFDDSTETANNAITAADSFAGAYAAEVLADSPQLYHRLAETSGTAMVDSSVHGRTGTYSHPVQSTVGQRVAGAVSDGMATTFTGTLPHSENYDYIAANASIAGPDVFTLEAWVKTVSTSGGRILGFADVQFGESSTYPQADRDLYITDDGRAHFHNAWFAGGLQSVDVASLAPVNDGSWHHLVATLGAGSAKLYVDGALQGSQASPDAYDYTGYWRVGGHAMDVNNVTDFFLDGAIDEAAVYNGALPIGRVSAHYAARTGGYAATVTADTPYLYWRLDDPAADIAGDAGGGGKTGTYRFRGPPLTTVVAGAGAVHGNAATRLDGATASAVNPHLFTPPQVFTLELWFRTTWSKGGLLLEFGDGLAYNDSSVVDRILYLTTTGRVRFGIAPVWNDLRTIESGPGLNDGQWHMVTGTFDSGGPKLYIDGVQVAQSATPTVAQGNNGYWRIGAENAAGWPDFNWPGYYAGILDEVSVYYTVLSPARITAHYAARTG